MYLKSILKSILVGTKYVLYSIFTASFNNREGSLFIILRILKIIVYLYIYFYKITKYPFNLYFLIRLIF